METKKVITTTLEEFMVYVNEWAYHLTFERGTTISWVALKGHYEYHIVDLSGETYFPRVFKGKEIPDYILKGDRPTLVFVAIYSHPRKPQQYTHLVEYRPQG